MDISIIIPCHNLEQYIKKLLLSFKMLNLSGIKAEFIFVLDACIDETQRIINLNMSDGFMYRIVHCNHHSCGYARNEGMKLAKGKYIWFVDGDDWIINPEVLQDCLKLMNENNLQIIKLKYISNYYPYDLNVMVWQYIYKAELIEDIKFVKTQPAEDNKFTQDVFQKLGNQNMMFYRIPSYFYNYNRPGSNTSIANKT